MIDKISRGTSPLNLDLVAGAHIVRVQRAGYSPMDTALQVSEAGGELFVSLQPAPPGVLVVRGDKLASIYVDGIKVAEDGYNSGSLRKPVGSYMVEVYLSAGGHKTDSTVVDVRSRERAVYDFSTHRVSYTPEGGQ